MATKTETASAPLPSSLPPVVIVDGDKGGVGKSTTAEGFIDALLHAEGSVAVVDGDTRNPDVVRMFEGMVATKSCNLRTDDGWMDLFDFVFEHKDKAVVISMPGGIGGQMATKGAEFCASMAQLNRPLHLVWVINRQVDSINLLIEANNTIGQWLHSQSVVKNCFYGDGRKFIRWDESETRKLIEKKAGKTFELAELNERVVDKLFSSPEKVVPFRDAAVDMDKIETSIHGLTPSENMALHRWLDQTGHMFKEMRAHMGLRP
ncbi:division plane positioning ATPase MipZ [Herbaspirillum huttiense]|uniref:division plane positioning ATPase MipZ n=1 Tax=Herbaspirillum huttiense TaxID=863372 RepID=UPI0037F6C9BA